MAVVLLIPVEARGGDAAPVSASSSPAGPLPDDCLKVRCRNAITFDVFDNSGPGYRIQVPPTPYVGDGIGLYPGDDFYVAGVERKGRLEELRYVDRPRKPKDVLHVTFAQKKNEAGHYDMVLKIESFFSRVLIYHAIATNPARPNVGDKTSTCPVFANGAKGIEMWPTPISFLKLMDFRFVERATSCAYY